MPADAHHGSWQVSARPWKAAALTLALVVALAGACEVAARTDAAKRLLPPPSYGTRIRFLDLQMSRLQAFVRNYGPVDCVLLGSSSALHSLDPGVFAQTYAEKTGRKLRCFNFGLPGASVDDVRALAPILRRDYGVRFFLYAATVRDVSSRALGVRLQASPWIARRTAEFNLDGFLTDTSAAFRYFVTFRRWLDPNREEPFVTFTIREDGFYPSRRVVDPNAVVTGWELQMLNQAEGVYDPRPFSGLLALVRTGAELVIVEIPHSQGIMQSPHVPEAARRFSAAYLEFRKRLSTKVSEAGAVFIEEPPAGTVPADGWADLVHMNERGAAAFSRWAAEATADEQRRASANRRAAAPHDG